jgi:hypothetical protein
MSYAKTSVFQEREKGMKKAIKLSIVILLITLTATAVSVVSCQSSALTNSQAAINSAYIAVTDAYKAGANTNQLIEQLNKAVNLTEQAQQLATGNSQQSEILANQALSIVQNVTEQSKTAQQSAANILPLYAAIGAAGCVSVGIVVYFVGPRVFWKFWYKLRRNYKLTLKKGNMTKNANALVITAEQICAIVLAVTIITAFISVSSFIIPSGQGEQFSELGILGPNMKLGDYPSQVVASDTVHLYGYVGNQMGQPMYYTVEVRLGDNNTQVNPTNLIAIQTYSQVLPSNGTWTFPINMPLNHVGDNQRIIFELWAYNQTLNQNVYQQRWGQIWVNVTSPAS